VSIVDTAAKTNSLKNDYGTSKGSNSPSTVYLAFFADSGYATELTGTGGIPRIPISNVDAQFTTSAAVTSNVNALTSSASTGSWASSATYAALMSTSSGAGDKWDGGAHRP
jgi:hypothetical protein